MKYGIEKIFVSQESKNDKLAIEMIERLPEVEVEEVKDYRSVKAYVLKNYEDPLGQGKKILYIARNKGLKIKKCPCTGGAVSCGYYVINMQSGCPIDAHIAFYRIT